MARFVKISKSEFESFLKSASPYVPFHDENYKFDWVNKDGEWEKLDLEIQEYCYALQLDGNLDKCIKVYSSIDRRTDESREKGRDAIRIVVADIYTLKPLRPKFTKIYRDINWKKHLRLRIAEALSSMGENIECPKCGSSLVPRTRNADGKRFLGCVKFPECSYSKDIRL